MKLRSASSGPFVYRRMLGDVDPSAGAGALVAVYDKTDAPYGMGLYNPKSLIALRMLSRGPIAGSAEALFAERLKAAVGLRRGALGLDASTEAYRVVHAEGDGLSGLVIDRFGGTLSIEYYSLGMFRQGELISRLLGEHFPDSTIVQRANEHVETMEGFRCPPSGNARPAHVVENGVRFWIDPAAGYKTGFFCDQRENRLALAGLVKGKRVLDVCGYSGGFALYAKKLGGAAEVTTVDLEPEAEALARKNANLNQIRLETVCADAFPYLRQMGVNNRRYDCIVLDPPKFIPSKEKFREGRQKYYDLNRMALGLIENGGLLVTCSCSGMLDVSGFVQILRGAAAAAGRRVQILRKSGAGPDHPVAIDFPEGEYLKVLWCRVLPA